MALIGVRRALINPRGAGGGLDPSTTAWVRAVVTAGGTVSGTQQTRVNNLIVAAKGHGYWSKLDVMYLYAAENATQAKIDIVALRTHTLNGTQTFTASQGYAGGGTATDFIDTGWAPSTGPNWGAVTASLGIYIRTNRSVTQPIEYGLLDVSSNATSLQPMAFGDWISNINGAAQNIVTSATNAQGFLVGSQTATGAGNNVLYRNGSSIGTTTGVSGTVASIHMYMTARNNNGTADRNFTDQFAMFFAGGALSSTDVANLSTDFNGGYMTSLGTNVY